MSERESALDEFKSANMSTMMKDLAIDKKIKEPWTGPGRDPRDDKWAPENEPTTNPGDEEDDDEDSGEDIDRSAFSFLLFRLACSCGRTDPLIDANALCLTSRRRRRRSIPRDGQSPTR